MQIVLCCEKYKTLVLNHLSVLIISPFIFVTGDSEPIASQSLLFSFLKIFLHLDKKRRRKEEWRAGVKTDYMPLNIIEMAEAEDFGWTCPVSFLIFAHNFLNECNHSVTKYILLSEVCVMTSRKRNSIQKLLIIWYPKQRRFITCNVMFYEK
jgi:hypothetical protein